MSETWTRSMPSAAESAQCVGKQRFEGSEARRLARRLNDKRPGFNAYRCPHCQGWHVGVLHRGFRP
jgi:hypothetical protein